MPKGLVDSIEEFDLNNYSLSGFFSEVVLNLIDFYESKELDQTDYNRIACASRILRNKSNDFMMKKEKISEPTFFWNFYGKRETDREDARKIYKNNLLNLSKDLANMGNLPREKIKELANTCSHLSKETANYFWNSQNSNGFKKY
jgi:hypothetical protein